MSAELLPFQAHRFPSLESNLTQLLAIDHGTVIGSAWTRSLGLIYKHIHLKDVCGALVYTHPLATTAPFPQMSFVFYVMVPALALAMVAETVTWEAPNKMPLKEAELSRCRGTRNIITRFATGYHVSTLVSRENFLALGSLDKA